jgi:mannose-6-phosphate isomerase
MFYPLTFHPIFKERIWGGRDLERWFNKAIPANVRIGESWEISDRPDDASVIANGPLAGRSLRWLMENDPAGLLGPRNPMPQRFPLLIKIIDAQEKLSLQVHPPAPIAAQLGGEPKTEMWRIVKAGPDAELFVGLKRGVTRSEFEKKIATGTVAECFHRIPVKAGDSVFLQSGRVHALGAQTLIFEVQQNSDTTYRVFDWNRLDASGKPRDLHVAQSLASIDFNDFESALLPSEFKRDRFGATRLLVDDPLFKVVERKLAQGESMTLPPGQMTIIGLVDGALRASGGGIDADLSAGQFCLFPAKLGSATIRASSPTTFLEIQ